MRRSGDCVSVKVSFAQFEREIPAAEIERLVTDQVCTFLSNDAEIFEATQSANREVAEPKRLVERAAKLSKAWATLSPAQTRSILRALIARRRQSTRRGEKPLILARTYGDTLSLVGVISLHMWSVRYVRALIPSAAGSDLFHG